MEGRYCMNTKFLLLLQTLALSLLLFIMPSVSYADGNSVSIENGASFASIEDAFVAAENNDTILVNNDLTIESTIKVPTDKNLSLNLDKHTLGYTGDKNMFIVEGGSFTIKNGVIVSKSESARAIQVSNSNLTLDTIEGSQFNFPGRGGFLSAEIGKKEDNTINILNCNFHDNSAFNSGGAISVRADSRNSEVINNKVNITNNIISNNKVSGSSYSFGGGIDLFIAGECVIKNNKIFKNQASVDETTYDYYWSHGGGLSIQSGFQSYDSPATIILEDNIISENSTQLFGGGIYFLLDYKKDHLDLRSGVFSANHSDFSGGAIDYSVHGQPTLKLTNAFFSENSSRSGGALWACPTSKIQTYSTLGASFIGNKTANNGIDSEYKLNGRDVRFEGSDTKISRISEGNKPALHQITLKTRSFLGNKVNWFKDNDDDPYQDGDAPLPSQEITNRSTTIGVLGKFIDNNEELIKKHKDAATLLFINNTAGMRGGAISTNSSIQIGEPEDLTLSVHKKWLKQDGTELTENIPSSIKVQLIRTDDTGKSENLEIVELKAESGWNYTFIDLPSKGMVSGKVHNFTYSVKEIDVPEGYKDSYEASDKNDNKSSSVEIINQKSGMGGLRIKKTVETSGQTVDLNKGYNFTLQLSDKNISGKYGDLEFSKGFASFVLKHGQLIYVKNLPVGISYTLKEELSSDGRYHSHIDNAQGIIRENSIVEISAVNTFNPPEVPPSKPPYTPPYEPSQKIELIPKTSDENPSGADSLFFLALVATTIGFYFYRKCNIEECKLNLP